MDPKEKTAEQLAQENAALKAENESLKAASKSRPAGGLSEAQEKIVREKMRAGLTREQAVEVLRAQEAWDEDPKNPNAKKK
jgi:hypothetical protein